MQVKEVKLTKVQSCEGKQLSDTFFKNCQFCEKLVQIDSGNFSSCIKIGGGKFYCPFCLRNNFHHKTSKNILTFSFRGIIGYYYYKFYIDQQAVKKLWFTQIKDYVHQHAYAGLSSPVLIYDPHTFLWFADFNKIGNHNRKAPFKEVKSVIHSIFDVFEVDKFLTTHAKDEYWGKYTKALDAFYEKRQRPKDKRMLIPTMCHHWQKDQVDFFEKTRTFIQPKLLLK